MTKRKGKQVTQHSVPTAAAMVYNQHKQRSDAAKIRARQALDDHWDGSRVAMIEWFFEVGNELKMRTWSSRASAQNTVYAWLADDDKTLANWVLDLIDKGLDAAYGTPEQPKPEIVKKQSKAIAHLDDLTKLQAEFDVASTVLLEENAKLTQDVAKRDRVIEELRRHIANRDTTIAEREATIAEREAEIRDLLRARATHKEAPDDSSSMKSKLADRYVEMLFDRVSQGDEAAMDHIEKLVGLK